MDYIWLSSKSLEAIKDFENLPNEQKVKKVVALLEGIKEKNTVFVELLDAIQTKENIPDDILVGIYTDIIALGEAVTFFDKRKKMNKMDKMKDYLKKIQALEQQQKDSENPDSLLEWL